jgi:O-antigen ligase
VIAVGPTPASFGSLLPARRHGGVMGLALVALAAGAVIATWLSPQLAAGLAVAALLLCAVAAWARPAEMLAVAAFFTLADPYVIRAITASATVATFPYQSELVLLAVGAPIAVRAVLEGRLVPALRHPATPFLAAWVAVAAASAVANAVPPEVAAAGVAVTLDGLAFFYLARMVGPDARLVRRLVVVFVAIMTVAALLAIAQVLLAPDLLGFKAFAGDFGEGGRADAFFGNPNQLAPLLAMALPFPVLALLDAEGRRSRALLLGVSLLLGTALWLTFSRSALVSTVLSFGLVAAIYDRRVLVMGAVLAALTLGVAMALPRNIAVVGDPNYANVSDPNVFDATFGRIGAIAAGNDLRVIFLEEGLPIAVDHPILGVGPGRYGGAAANVFGTPVYNEYGVSLHGFHTVHDYWLHLLVETGALGLAAMLAAVVVAAVRLLRTAAGALGADRVLLLATAIGLLLVTIDSFAEMLLEGNTPSYALWFLVGMASVVGERVMAARTAGR